jgi:hypothetical protein
LPGLVSGGRRAAREIAPGQTARSPAALASHNWQAFADRKSPDRR